MRYSTLEKLLKTQFNLIAVETKQLSTVLDNFRQYSSLNGTAVYIWKKETGLYRQNLSHVKIPQTASILQALNYIQKHQQQSIFILTDITQYLYNPVVNNALLTFNKIYSKKLFLVDEALDLPAGFKHIALETKKLLQMKLQRAA